MTTPFQSTHPVRGATLAAYAAQGDYQFQSTHPVRGATCRSMSRASVSVISIHAPREGCDILESRGVGNHVGFQSTHPVRGATGW